MLTSKIDGLIPAGTVLHGTLEFGGTLWVDAEVHGTIQAPAGAGSTLIIGPRAQVCGAIEADRITVYGSVTGRIRAHETLVFEHGARVVAEEIVHRGFTIRSGAHVEGALVPASRLEDAGPGIQPHANVQPLHADRRRAPAAAAAPDRNRQAPAGGIAR